LKVMLIYLPHPYLKRPDSQAPLGLMYIAAILENAGIDVDLLNLTSCKSLEEGIALVTKADIYGITVTSIELPWANDFASLLKQLYPDSIIGLGGPGTYTTEFIDWSVIDFIYQGEAEKDIVSTLEKAVTVKSEKTIYSGGFFDNLDDIPFPARHKLKGPLGGQVFAYGNNYIGEESTVIITSRGCSFHCAFCASPYSTALNGGFRCRSPKNVYDEIISVIDRYGVRQFRFSDDNLTRSKKRILQLCEMIKGIDIAWRASIRANTFDEEIATAMRKAGCRELSFGIESFDDDVLKLLNKNAITADNIRGLKICAESGINSRILLMVRTPGQTRKTIEINKEYLRKVPYSMVCCTTFVPIPGSDIWNNPGRYGVEIINKNLRDYNFYMFGEYGENELNPVINIKDRDIKEINKETLDFREFLKSTGKLNKG
jgi:anaerobic magnesium-protoporphyrin IX monomethyl ester cyclase